MKRKIRVLHVYRTYYPDTQGGLEETIRQICVHTRDQVESRVFTLSPDPHPTNISNPEALVVRARRHLELASCSIGLTCVHQFVQQTIWADIVHYHFPWPFADFLHFAGRIKKPSLVTYHSDIVRQRLLGTLYHPLQVAFLSSVKRIVCTSPNYFATSNVLSKIEDKVDVIPIGISESPSVRSAPSNLDDVRKQYGSDFFLFVGVLRYYKGLHILLDAIKNAPYQVVIAGSGPTETELMDQAKKLNLTNVTFAGYVDDAVRDSLFKLSKAIVFPSYLRAEAFGVTLLEGAMHAKPLISTEVGSGTSHVNVHGLTGLVVPPGSARSLRKALDQIHNDSATAAQMGFDAQRRYRKMFTGELMGKRYCQVYSELAPGVADPSPSDAELAQATQ